MQVAWGKKHNNWEGFLLFQKPQDCGSGHLIQLVEMWTGRRWTLLVGEVTCSGMLLMICFSITADSSFGRNRLDFMCQELCVLQLQSGAKAFDDLYSPQDWSALIGFPCTCKLCACDLSLITGPLRLEGISGDHLAQHPAQSRVS